MRASAEDPVEPETLLGPTEPEASLFVGPIEDPDRYELVGMGIWDAHGTTWQARYRGDLPTPLIVGVSVLRRPSSAGPRWPTEADRRRWRDQTELLRHLRIDHLLSVHDVTVGAVPHPFSGRDAGAADCVLVETEWVGGETLEAAVRGRPATTDTVTERMAWAAQLSNVVDQLHSRTRMGGNPGGHRVLLPTSVVVAPDRGVVLVDLGWLQPAAERSADKRSPEYAAPEVRARPRDPVPPSADRFAVGALAFLLFTGQDPPLEADRRREVLEAWVASAGLDTRFVDTLLALFGEVPDERPQDLVAWAAELGRLQRTRSPRPIARRALLGTTGVVAAAGLFTVGFSTTTAASRARTSRPALVGADQSGPAVAHPWWERRFPAFAPLTVSGSGDRSIPLPTGAVAGIVTLSYRDATSFILTLPDEQSSPFDLAYSPSDFLGPSYAGSRVIGLVSNLDGDDHPTSIAIETDGRWRVAVRSFRSLRRWPGHETGDGVFRYDGGAPRTVPYSQRGRSGADRTAEEVLEIQYWGEAKRQLHRTFAAATSNLSPATRSIGKLQLPSAPVIVTVQCTGPWTVG